MGEHNKRVEGSDQTDVGPGNPSDGIRAALSLDGDVDAIKQYYDGWADEYDKDVGSEEYALPEQVARLLDQVVRMDIGEPIDGLVIDPAPPTDRNDGGDGPSILDVGCGTGLIGVRLAAAGYRSIDGIDLSEPMVEVARTRGCYRTLTSGVDITAPLPDELVGQHDIVLIGGVFTVGHVPPETMTNVARMVRPGGLLLVTTRRQYYEETEFQAVTDGLQRDGVLRLLTADRDMPYTLDSTGHYWAYLVTATDGDEG